MPLPHPILSLITAPVDSTDRERLHDALARFSVADPALSFSVDSGSGITTVRGESVAELEALCRRLEEEDHIPLAFASLQVLCVETIRHSAEAEGKYIRQTGGSGNYAHVKLRLEPDEQAKGIEFLNEIKGGVIPPHFIPPIEAGIREAAQGGILSGGEMVGLRARLYDGSFHESDSNDAAYRIAAALAFRDAAMKAGPIMLEPVMTAIFTVSEARLASAMAEISARRGRVESATNIRGAAILSASIPLAEMLRHNELTPTTMTFTGFEPVPSDIDGIEPAGSVVRNPLGPRPRTGSAAADPEIDSDWT